MDSKLRCYSKSGGRRIQIMALGMPAREPCALATRFFKGAPLRLRSLSQMSATWRFKGIKLTKSFSCSPGAVKVVRAKREPP
ncbi:hypothetical protein XabCFBP2524_22375 [Xanthomonas axonopodis pv. begoniae]|nr:hypothetical protein XabCFBP2524_22375 [Xanthomonas axonopodis pv. begoniae]